MEAMLMMRPPVKLPGAVPFWRASMRLATSCATKNAPLTLVSKMKSKSSGATSCRRCVVLTPELFTRMSIEPISVSAWATADWMEPRSVTSSSTTCASPPSPSMRARSSLSLSTRRLASTTPAPAAASVRANCAPRPLDAPVTNATRPDKSML